jgi:hypothetical protein
MWQTLPVPDPAKPGIILKGGAENPIQVTADWLTSSIHKTTATLNVFNHPAYYEPKRLIFRLKKGSRTGNGGDNFPLDHAS